MASQSKKYFSSEVDIPGSGRKNILEIDQFTKITNLLAHYKNFIESLIVVKIEENRLGSDDFYWFYYPC